MLSITISLGKEKNKYYLTHHFIQRLQERFQKSELDEVASLVRELINSSKVAFRRPNQVKILLRHGLEESLYLINIKHKAVISLVRSTEDQTWSILKTVYRFEDCAWANQWVSSPGKKMNYAKFMSLDGYNCGSTAELVWEQEKK